MFVRMLKESNLRMDAYFDVGFYNIISMQSSTFKNVMVVSFTRDVILYWSIVAVLTNQCSLI